MTWKFSVFTKTLCLGRSLLSGRPWVPINLHHDLIAALSWPFYSCELIEEKGKDRTQAKVRK
jgi:hypothetical protein